MSARHSARLQSKTAINYAAIDDDEPIASSSKAVKKRGSFDSDYSSRNVKRQKREPDNSVKRARRGKLKDWIAEMPMDILFETFSHLRPLDLLHVARTTKALRSALMSRKATSIWKTARERYESDLPDRPDHIGSEPQYASLLFETQCHYCGTPNSSTILWEIGFRSCLQCFLDQSLIAGDAWLKNAQLNDTDLAAWETLKPFVPMHEHRSASTSHQTVSFRPASLAQSMLSQYQNLDDMSKSEWLKKEREATENRKNFARECQTWLVARNEARRNELEDVRRKRVDDIIQRLRSDGFADDIDGWPEWAMYFFESHKHVRKSQPLTNRIWENIQGDIIDHVAAVSEMVAKDPIFSALSQWRIFYDEDSD